MDPGKNRGGRGGGNSRSSDSAFLPARASVRRLVVYAPLRKALFCYACAGALAPLAEARWMARALKLHNADVFYRCSSAIGFRGAIIPIIQNGTTSSAERGVQKVAICDFSAG